MKRVFTFLTSLRRISVNSSLNGSHHSSMKPSGTGFSLPGISPPLFFSVQNSLLVSLFKGFYFLWTQIHFWKWVSWKTSLSQGLRVALPIGIAAVGSVKLQVWFQVVKPWIQAPLVLQVDCEDWPSPSPNVIGSRTDILRSAQCILTQGFIHMLCQQLIVTF